MEFNFEKNQENYDLFFKTLVERHIIWYKRFIEKAQHLTDDIIFQNYKFTNIYRELDRNTQWQIQHIISDKELTLREMVWKILFFRLINNVQTFEIAEQIYGWKHGIPTIDEYDSDMFYKYLEHIKAEGKTAFTSSYLVYNGPGSGTTRNNFFAKQLFVYLNTNIDEIITTLQTAKSVRDILNYFENIEGIGRFNAYQIYIDLTYIDVFSHLHLFDFKKDDDINVGPGSTTGAQLLFNNMPKKYTKDAFHYLKEQANTEIQKICIERNIKFPYVKFGNEGIEIVDDCTITITEIEHWLCEFQKYYGVLHDSGKTRKRFVPAPQNIKFKIK